MLNREAFDSLFGFLDEALRWQTSDTTRSIIYDRIASHHSDNDFLKHVEKFCDRGHGTAAQFMAYLKEERRREMEEGKPAVELPPSVNPAQLLMGDEREDPAWHMPFLEQIRVSKWMALRKLGWAVSFEEVEVTEKDLDTIRLSRLSRLTPTQAFLEVMQEAQGENRTKKSSSGMTSIAEAMVG